MESHILWGQITLPLKRIVICNFKILKNINNINQGVLRSIGQTIPMD
jgi:mannitol-specific phosphotransferase system IIBC component